MTRCLSQFPSNQRNSNGSLQHANKDALFHYFQVKFPNMIIIQNPQNTALILDGITIIQQLAVHVPATFVDMSIYIFRYIINLASFYMSSRVDFAYDKYNPLSIKDSERRQHLIFPGYLCVLNENQKTPIEFQKFLMFGKTKESLVLFMVMYWKKLAQKEFHGKTVFALLSQRCFMLSLQKDTNKVITETLQELNTDHGEADALLLLHVKHASTVFPSIIIKTPDTDVFSSLPFPTE